ncbi:MAG: hypothetical protein HUJ25_08220, partial [Crocinitomicaceae bacterium]|nr:hypothetical protein [Crocinitomicaceae bacterium]
MKRLLLLLTLIPVFVYSQGGAGGPDCASMQPICTDVGATYTSNANISEASVTDPGNDYGCLITQPNPSWYYFEISTAGNINMDLSAAQDVDFIIWGPFSSLSAAQAGCGSLGTSAPIHDCSYSPAANENPQINNPQVGEVYIMLITNYANVVQNISLTQVGGPGATDCSIVNNPPCGMANFDVQIGGCQFATNTYDITGSITFSDPPTSGSLVVEDCNGNITVVDTAPFGASPLNYSLTGLAADGLPCDVEAYFTADPACSQSQNYVAPVCINNCPTYNLNASSPLEACGNQIYYMEIENSGCDGFVEFDIIGNYGSSFANEITWDVTSNATGNVVASGGPGCNSCPINTTVGPLDPNVEGTVYTLCVYDSWGDGFNGGGGYIEAQENGNVLTGTISGNFGASSCNVIQVGVTVSSSTLTVQTPSGPVTSVMGNCSDHEVGFTLDNTNFCTPIAVDLPWTIVCDNSGTLIASGTHTVTVFPQIPTDAADLVTITYNTATCSWDVSPNNDCDSIDVGNIFTITPDPYTLNQICADGNQDFTVDYTGFSQGPSCCATGGPVLPITYNTGGIYNDFSAQDSPFGGTNNSAYLTIPGNGTGGNATGFSLDVDMSGFCFNPPGFGGGDEYWVTIYVDGVIVYDQMYNPPPNGFNLNLGLGDLPNGYNENSVIDIYIYPNTFSSGATNTTFGAGAGCGPNGYWDASSITATLDVTYEQVAPTPANCTFITTSPYICCAPILPHGLPPADQTVACTSDIPAANPGLVTNVVGSCNPVVTHLSDSGLSGNICGGTVTRTYRITDDCGNIFDTVQVFTVNDTIPPTGTAPPNATYQCIGDVPPMSVNDITDEADNCTNPGVSLVSNSTDGNTCPETITRVYRIADFCGNETFVTQTITVDDTTPPTASNPAGITVQCIADVPAANPLVVTDEADNCTAAPIVAFVSDVSDGNTCPETITRTYSVTDNCGNSINVTQTITVDDTTPPTASNPAGVVVECIADVPAADPLVVTDEADNCTANPVVAFVSDVSDGNTCPETITRTYSVTDDCGNTINVTQTITVDDITPPTGTAPANVTVECIADVPVADPLLITDEADNCTANPVVVFVSDVSDGNTCPETITRTYSITDDCGNSINVTQTITVDDITPPTGTAPADILVMCVADVPAADPLLITDEADNCTAAPTVTHLSDVDNGLVCPKTITRTYRITDDCGNISDVVQVITVNDTVPPTGTAPANATYQCIGDVPPMSVNDITDEADNCSVPGVSLVSNTSDGNTCPETITRTYRIADFCGNETFVTQTITVDDTTPPTGTAPANVTVECIADVPVADPLLITDEADNCTANPVVAFVSDVSDGNTCPETITRTYSITDDCGNSINVTQTITVDDITPPTGTAPANVTVECIADVPVADPLLITDEADNCTANPVVAFVSDVSDGNTCPETITRTYSITDDCGNSINVTQTITVDDITPPTGTAPANVTVECIADVPVADPLLITDE